MDYKTILGTAAVIIAIVSFFPYIRDTLKGKTKPHAFSWLVWSIIMGVGFAAQISDGAGTGAWVTSIFASFNFLIFLLSLKWGEKNITTSDWASLVAAAFGVLLWWITSSPLLTVILIVTIYFFGYYPTIRKSFHKPREETLYTHASGVLEAALSFLALQHVSIITALLPAGLFTMNLSFVLMVLIRRKQLPEKK
jgi:hypothetical protein